jgi:hypothetical protein
MKRRTLLHTLATIPAVGVMALPRREGDHLDNPYAGVVWEECEFMPSMSHQHQGQTDSSREVFYEMGYRHFAFSNYYPSRPTYPLPAEYLAKRTEVVGAPNAEHHSYTDSGLHANALGSLLDTGYGQSVSAKRCGVSPIEERFENLNVFDAARPWLGVYRIDVRLVAKKAGAEASAVLNIEGAHECRRGQFEDLGPVQGRVLKAGNHTIYLRTLAGAVDTKLSFDPELVEVTQYRLMQGTNRPWRDIFRAALDGDVADGKRNGGLLVADGGGMTLNHPYGAAEDYFEMLDFDPRVLGIEVWNQLASGFGSRGRGAAGKEGPAMHFYNLWDDLLRSGRRCWGFFVKDHNTYGRGRNILLLPAAKAEREANALRAYRQGTFYGAVSAVATNDAGEAVPPYDRSDFRFARLEVTRDVGDRELAIHVVVRGQDEEKRPHVQIRFVTDAGIAQISDVAEAAFELPRDATGRLAVQFVRVEAFAYPSTHLGGEPLTAAKVREMNVYDLSQVHDRKSGKGTAFSSNRALLRVPIPTVDMIFSQPLRRV